MHKTDDYSSYNYLIISFSDSSDQEPKVRFAADMLSPDKNIKEKKDTAPSQPTHTNVFMTATERELNAVLCGLDSRPHSPELDNNNVINKNAQEILQQKREMLQAKDDNENKSFEIKLEEDYLDRVDVDVDSRNDKFEKEKAKLQIIKEIRVQTETSDKEVNKARFFN